MRPAASLVLVLLLAALPLSSAALAGDAPRVEPLMGEAPAWWTPAAREGAVVAAGMGLAFDVVEQRPAAVGPPSQAVVRPGTMLFADSTFPSWCTAAFAYAGGARIATAGHCTRVAGDRVYAHVAPNKVVLLGTTALTTGNGGVGNDWALVDVLPLWQPLVDEDAAFVGGPCGRVPATADLDDAPGGTLPHRTLAHVGHGTGVGTGGTPRVATAVSLTSSTLVFNGLINGGDSGGPILSGHVVAAAPEPCAGPLAIGIVTHTTCHPEIHGTCVPVDPRFGTYVGKIPGAMGNGNGLPV